MAEYVFISSWLNGDALSGAYRISQYEFNPGSGELGWIGNLNGTERVDTTYVDEKRNILYALYESPDLPSMRAGGGGCVYAFRLDPVTGSSEQISCEPTFCPNPTHLSLDATGRYLVVANHATHSYITKIGKDDAGRYYPIVEFDDSLVELFSINEDGAIGELIDVIKHTGSGPAGRQKNAHPHSAVISPSGKLFAVCDKGTDGVYMYKIDRERGKLVPCGHQIMTPPGTMPRYCVFHPTLPFFYHNCEGVMDVLSYRYNEEGRLYPLGSFSSLPEGHVRPEGSLYEQQGLCMHPSGKFLYDILNGPDSIAVFRVGQEDGALTLIQNQPAGYEWPRGAALSPDGRFLLVTCWKGGKAVMFSVDGDGRVYPTGHEYDHPAAAYATFWKPR